MEFVELFYYYKNKITIEITLADNPYFVSKYEHTN